MDSEAKVTGIGGMFFKCDDPDAIKDWYRDHLGLKTNPYGSVFEFRSANNPEERNFLQWSIFPAGTDYFQPSTKEFMINYRVKNLERLIDELRASDVEIVGEIESFEYGKFAHILDPEGNKIELWEPVDSVFAEIGDETTH